MNVLLETFQANAHEMKVQALRKRIHDKCRPFIAAIFDLLRFNELQALWHAYEVPPQHATRYPFQPVRVGVKILYPKWL